MLTNLSDLGSCFLKTFKERFLDPFLASLEQELPASENRVEPLYLEVIFRLQLVYQTFQGHLEQTFTTLQADKSLLNNLEALKVDTVDYVSNKVQVFNERIVDNVVKQVGEILNKN